PSLPPPPRHTLFPYTTLFRSTRDQLGRGGDEQEPAPADQPTERAHDDSQRDVGGQHAAAHVRAGATRHDARTYHHRNDRPEPEQDRKSTRLNSSHVAISYAVF